MNHPQRLFIIGHHGAGKGLLSKEIALALGWRFVDADFGLESRIGRNLTQILGEQGSQAFYDCQFEILTSLCTQEHLVIATDSSVVCSEKNRQLLSNQFSVFLDVSTSVQMTRISRNDHPLLTLSSWQDFFDKLHAERDSLFEEVSQLIVPGDDSALEKHVQYVLESISGKKGLEHQNSKPILDKKDLILFHKEHHAPIHLTQQQAITLKLLAEGKTAKEIARETHVSYRTVEGTIAKLQDSLGCFSSKELIALYHKQP